MRTTPCLIAMCVAIGSVNLAAQTAVPAPSVQVAVTNATNAVSAVVGATQPATATIAPAMPGVIPAVVPPTPRIERQGDLRITNLSTRARVTSENPLVTGFAISGATSRTVLVRAAGPALNAFGVSDAVAAPRLRLHAAAGAVVAENAGWSSAPLAGAAIASTGAFPFATGSADAAVVATLAPGTYTAEVLAEGGAGGVTLIEVYDVDGTAAGSRLSNVSTLGTVTNGGGEVISGFVLAGTGSGQYLLRGVGPGLAKVGVTGVLADPVLTVFDSAGRQLTTNDDWDSGTKPSAGIVYVGVATSSQGAAVATVSATAGGSVTAPTIVSASLEAGAFALDSKSFDAALLTTLSAGAYTVVLSGNSARVTTPVVATATGASSGSISAVAATVGTPVSITLVPSAPGTALLEVYELP